MICGVLDPYLLTVPAEDSTAEQVLSFAESIVQWRSALGKHGFAFCMLPRYWQAISEARAFPAIEVLRQRLSARGIDRFDAQTLFRIVAWFFDRARELNQVAGISEVLFDEEHFVLDIPWLIDRLPPGVQSVLKHCLAICAIARLGRISDGSRLILLSADQHEPEPGYVNVSFRLEDCEYLGDHAGEVLSCPCQVGGGIPLAFVPGQVLDHVGIGEIWENAELAVSWGYRRAVSHHERNEWPLPEILSHRSFNSSFREHSLDEGTLGVIFRKIALLVSRKGIGQPGLQLHPLCRGGPAGPQDIRARDGAGAMRMQVEQHGRGLQVHYWDLGSGLVELAALRSHDDYSIPE